MSSVHTLSSLSKPLPAAPSSPAPAPASAQPRLHLYPITTDHASSVFKDIQAGPHRTVMPSFSNPYEERQYRKEHLALVFRALHRQGLGEGVAGEWGVCFGGLIL
jgi:hypothetical protein